MSGDHAKELVVFLSEFFHPDHGSNITDVVIFGYNPPSPLIIPKLGLQPQGNSMEYVQIQPGEYSELLRARADRANAVFILNSSATYESPRELDSRASLYMVLVKQCVLALLCKRLPHAAAGSSRALLLSTCQCTCSCC